MPGRNVEVSKSMAKKGKLGPHIKRKPHVNVRAASVIESVVEDFDRPPAAYTAGRTAVAGTYGPEAAKRMPVYYGAYARASTFDACTEASIAQARCNGPAAGAGAHVSLAGAGAYATAEVARAEASLAGASVGVGLNVNTGASIGYDGLDANVLGFGVSVGPRAVKTPVADASCCVM